MPCWQRSSLGNLVSRMAIAAGKTSAIGAAFNFEATAMPKAKPNPSAGRNKGCREKRSMRVQMGVGAPSGACSRSTGWFELEPQGLVSVAIRTAK